MLARPTFGMQAGRNGLHPGQSGHAEPSWKGNGRSGLKNTHGVRSMKDAKRDPLFGHQAPRMTSVLVDISITN
jgi:hypothetical protein